MRSSTSPITNKSTLDEISTTRSWELNATLVNDASAMSLFINWLKRDGDSLWSFWAVRYFLAPLAILGSALSIFFSVRQAFLKKDAHSIANAVVEVLAACAITIAAIGVIASIAALVIVGPILLTAAVCLRAAFDLCSALGYAIHALIEPTPAMQAVYRTEAKKHLVDGVLGGLISAAAITLMVVASPVIQTVMASIAIAASVAAVIHYIVKAVRSSGQLKAEADALREKEYEESTDKQVLQTLNPNATKSQKNIHREEKNNLKNISTVEIPTINSETPTDSEQQITRRSLRR